MLPDPAAAPATRPPRLLPTLLTRPGLLATYLLLGLCCLLYACWRFLVLPVVLLGLFLAFGERRPGRAHPADALAEFLKKL